MNDKKCKILTMPMEGSMVLPEHSKKLEWALRDFIKSTGNGYYDDDIKNGILASYFKLNNGICVEQKVQIRKDDYVCHTTLSCSVSPDNADRLLGFVRVANAINRELDYGNFEVNETTGDILFRSYYKPEENVSPVALDMLLGYPKYIINLYGHFFEMHTENGNV